MTYKMSYRRWIHEFFQVRPTQFAIPVICDVASIHDLTKEVTEVFPWDLGRTAHRCSPPDPQHLPQRCQSAVHASLQVPLTPCFPKSPPTGAFKRGSEMVWVSPQNFLTELHSRCLNTFGENSRTLNADFKTIIPRACRAGKLVIFKISFKN